MIGGEVLPLRWGSVRGACKSREVPCTFALHANASDPHSAGDEERLFESDVMKMKIVRGRRFVRDDGVTAPPGQK